MNADLCAIQRLLAVSFAAAGEMKVFAYGEFYKMSEKR
jgi:hypothetical protein